jgi:acetate kinase
MAPAPFESFLILNSGSSSLKFRVIERGTELTRLRGIAEALGTAAAVLSIEDEVVGLIRRPIPMADHHEALLTAMDFLSGECLAGVGHRVVHGGERFAGSVRVDDAVIAGIGELSKLAPLHHPAHLAGIRAVGGVFPDLPQVVVFDTAFHQTLPREAYLYALPYEYYEREGVRRYGFHGSSHQSVSAEAARLSGREPGETQWITAHLGNGCSVCAVREGRSVDTSMGFTPLEGLMMGTRSGSVDPNLVAHLASLPGHSLSRVMDVLNRESGLLGLSGLSHDLRDLEAVASKGHERAALAIDVFCYRLAKGILEMAAGLDRIDGIVFTGGIGENSALVRARTLGHLRVLRPVLDAQRNAGHGRQSAGRITCDDSPLLALVVPTDEERVIARETERVIFHSMTS